MGFPAQSARDSRARFEGFSQRPGGAGATRGQPARNLFCVLDHPGNLLNVMASETGRPAAIRSLYPVCWVVNQVMASLLPVVNHFLHFTFFVAGKHARGYFGCHGSNFGRLLHFSTRIVR